MSQKLKITVEIPFDEKENFYSEMRRLQYAEVTATTAKRPRKTPPRTNESTFALPTLEELEQRPAPVTVFGRLTTNDHLSPVLQPILENSANNPTPSPPITEPKPDVPHCSYCLQSPCVVGNMTRSSGPEKVNNHRKRYPEYRKFYTILNRAGLWTNPTYLIRKQELGCYIDEVREVMPECVVRDVRRRWPNPPHISYVGHKRC